MPFRYYQLTAKASWAGQRDEKSRRTQLKFLRCLLLQVLNAISVLNAIFRDLLDVSSVHFSGASYHNVHLHGRLTLGCTTWASFRHTRRRFAELCQWMLMVTSLHSPLATLIILATTTPYRRAIIEWFTTGLELSRSLRSGQTREQSVQAMHSFGSWASLYLVYTQSKLAIRVRKSKCAHFSQFSASCSIKPQRAAASVTARY